MKIAKKDAIVAWHFTDGMKLMDGQVLKQGKVYHVPDIKICERGLHASKRLIDAFEYAKGSVLSQVRCWGNVETQSDKIVAEYRVADTILDIDFQLHWWATDIASDALGYCGVTDQRSWDAIETKRSWLCGNSTDDELDEARSAAWDASWDAWNAAWNASWNASLNAAWDVSWDVSWSDVRSAARSTIRSVARSVRNVAQDETWSVVRDELNDSLESYILEQMEE